MKNTDYWKKFWDENKILKNENKQQQIGRTIDGIPIDDELWSSTLKYLDNKLELNKDDVLLDLCAGNGLLSIPFSQKCKSVVSVDYSNKLISRIDTSKYTNITPICGDVRKLDFESNSFSKVIIYFAIQHFTEKEVEIIMSKIHLWLKRNGILFIGDIPDKEKIWSFYYTPELKKRYSISLKQNKPIIGTWFEKSFFYKTAENIGLRKFKSIDQPEFLINSKYRFDFIASK